MKTKLSCSLLLLAAALAPGALAADDQGERNSHAPRTQSLIIPVEDPTAQTGPTSAGDNPNQALQGYDTLMIALTQKFSATLASIADAAKRGELSSDQAREMSAEQYQLTHMQFELLSMWRGIEERDLAKVPDVEAKPDSKQENEVVMVALPFSSFQLTEKEILASRSEVAGSQEEDTGVLLVMTGKKRS